MPSSQASTSISELLWVYSSAEQLTDLCGRRAGDTRQHKAGGGCERITHGFTSSRSVSRHYAGEAANNQAHCVSRLHPVEVAAVGVEHPQFTAGDVEPGAVQV